MFPGDFSALTIRTRTDLALLVRIRQKDPDLARHEEIDLRIVSNIYFEGKEQWL